MLPHIHQPLKNGAFLVPCSGRLRDWHVESGPLLPSDCSRDVLPFTHTSDSVCQTSHNLRRHVSDTRQSLIMVVWCVNLRHWNLFPVEFHLKRNLRQGRVGTLSVSEQLRAAICSSSESVPRLKNLLLATPSTDAWFPAQPRCLRTLGGAG